MAKNLTINELAKTVNELTKITINGFAAVNKRMDEMEKEMATKKELEELARMTANSFNIVFKEIAEIRETMASKEELYDLEERLNYRWGNQFDALRDDKRLVKTKLSLI